MMDETVYWAHLASVEGMGGALFEELLKRFGSLKRALEAPVHEVKEIPSMDETTAEAICRAAQSLSATQAKIERIARRGVRVLTRLDNAYPARLRQASNPPPVIYQAGDLEAVDDQAVAIIGSRDCTQLSARRARGYAKCLAQHRITVVSGYAEGVDINAHLGALEAGGRTLIIPGCGAEKFDFASLETVGIRDFHELADRAVWISEQPPDADWSTQGSLARNRLVAAQAKAVIVIEARLDSSTLVTVAGARALKSPIFVQNFSTLSQRVMGNEMLRREKATLIQDEKDLDTVIRAVKGEVGPGKKRRDDDPRR
jgi:DNA processing protein